MFTDAGIAGNREGDCGLAAVWMVIRDASRVGVV